MEEINLKDLYIEELEKILYDISREKYRAKQIFRWIHRGVCSFGEMTDLSAQLREELTRRFSISCLKMLNVQKTDDGTRKYLFELSDGNAVESVLMKYKHGNSACLSTQVGCKMGCRFCASEKCGFVRNLTAGEIVDQVLTIQRDIGERISSIVFMGIGEPLDNYENTIKAMKLLNHPEGLNIGYRHISVSTCGLIPAINRLAGEKLPITLSISLHASNDKIRDKIMPINKKYKIDDLLEACKNYIKTTNRRISFEYIMILNLNDSEKEARELASLLKGMLAHVNLIRFNEVSGKDFKSSSMDRIKKFKETLERSGIETTVRRELGNEIEAACGQLRLKRKLYGE